MIQFNKWCFGSDLDWFRNTVPGEPECKGTGTSHKTVLKRQECETIQQGTFQIAGAICIVMPLQFSSLQFWSWSIDLLRKHRESYVWYCFFNLIMLENRAQMPKTLQIFSYGSVYSYSRMLYHPHGLCSAELRRTQRFISKCTVMNVFLEMLSYLLTQS